MSQVHTESYRSIPTCSTGTLNCHFGSLNVPHRWCLLCAPTWKLRRRVAGVISTMSEAAALHGQAKASSILSILSSGVVIYWLLDERGFFDVFRGRDRIIDSDPHRLRMTTLILVLSLIDIVASFHWMLGPVGDTSKPFCDYQGFMIQWFALGGIVWNVCMAHNLYNWLVLNRTPKQLSFLVRKTERRGERGRPGGKKVSAFCTKTPEFKRGPAFHGEASLANECVLARRVCVCTYACAHLWLGRAAWTSDNKN
eukprot:scaffold145_cov261-Pinguiococcus_pyrenoidosus.AAC.2